ncbi:serine hydrolase domain-containing protein [Nesterenkonia sp. DZ6]|uniref:serine hydrolase domain-containing protein n=1 Tax=Nesterenkonia sp. DZ6 TaxID=2901229 RepID=UPI001F4CD335|nr:serine hydrolase domain-containing protein [Nesterenkonia sp. DZ6]MCH8559270.1 beta-lactamase family protein [Nesterenkonia sp. DZ6]
MTVRVSRFWLRVLTAVAAALLLMVPAPTSVAVSQGGVRDTADEAARSIERAEDVLGEQLEEVGIPGGAVAVVSGGRVQARGVGDAGAGRAATGATPFVIGSASKSFTALAVLQLVDSGEVELDAPVREYVPEFELAPGEPVDEITVRHLLQQTSGLDDLTGGPLLASAADGTPEEAVAEVSGAVLVSSPGERWAYANVNFVLAGLVVERVSGLTYGDYVQLRIFDPLEMTHSHVASAPAAADGLSSGHRFWFGLPVATDPTQRQATLAAGYLISSAEDLGRYLAMYLAGGLAADGTRIVSAEALETMLAPAMDAHLGPWADGQASHYAMGWFRGGPWGDDVVFHPGNTPDTSTLLLFSPAEDVAVATVVNASNESPVPGNPFISDRVTRNVAHAALGQPVLELPSFQRFYLLFDLAVLIPLGLALWGLLRASRAVGTSIRERRRVWRGVGVATRTVTAAALVLLLMTLGWASAWTWAPDLALVVAALAVILFLTAVLRLLPLLRRRDDAHAAAGPASRDRLPARQGPRS